jgi:uncharacterized protein (DUF1499 family)
MKAMVIVVVLLLAATTVGYLLLERRPGYGIYYGLAKLSGAPLDIGPVDWATLRRRRTPNDALICPPERCPEAKPDRVAPTYPLEPAALLAQLRDIVRRDADVVEIPCSSGCDHAARFIQYSRLMRYPDTIDIAVFAAPEGRSTLALYSRSLVGHGDFGVNRARLERWLAALDRG